MNQHSLICHFISKHSDWEDKLKEKGIGITKENNLAVFKYMIDADFSDPYVQEARGIIIDLTTLEVVCWPFRKFGNWNESYADKIDWSSAKVQEKVDGSLMKLYFYNNEWVWATNSTIRIDNVSNPGGIAFSSILHKAENYKDINYDLLDQDCTYLFELVSPDNQIILTYPKTMLYHIGTRNNVTGMESNPDIGIRKPKCYGSQKDLKYWLTTVEGKQNATNPQMEGYVVVDKDYHRIKIKTPEYLTAHRISGNGILTKDTALNYILFGEKEKIAIVSNNPKNKAKIKFYEWQIAELISKVHLFIAYVRGLYEETGERKAVAMAIKNHPLSDFGFRSIGNEYTAEELIEQTYTKLWSSFLKYIPDYESFAKGE